jgi:hypothetical protein
MTTNTWTQLGGGLALAINAAYSFFKMRAMRGQMTRRLLFPFLGQLVSGLIFGFMFFGVLFSSSSSGLLPIFYFTAVAAK